ncbi:divergent AAA domain protein [Leptotrichia wadei]|uniref:Divergent AAA domain protein n=1 Tax=Leptotrichia wadei TaxID=157687 RepID=A0A510KSH7_9FUSO|nr:RNA-binding domain-containing protein [Leptotrichia wadei]BBM54700.1 divergent AAA domain protein [Leptotrichia wadei]
MRKESKDVEFKERITRSYLKTVSAYANYKNGKIIFGINDEGEAIGLEKVVENKLNIENTINDTIKPKPEYTLDIEKIEGKSYIVLNVKKGDFPPYYYNGKAYKRNDTSTIEVDTVELNRLILQGSNLDYEAIEIENEKLEFKFLEKKMKEVVGIKELNLDILKTLNLYENKKFNIAAELFADNNNRKFSGIDIVVLGENINKILFRENIERKSILEQYYEAISVFERYYEYEEIVGAERIKKEKVSKEAFRESVANAIVHRLWDINANIKIVMSNDKIEIISPGSLPLGMSEDEYMRGYVSVLRNPIIANIFYRLGIIEKFGTGIKRIKYEYRESFVKPAFEIYENSIRITLPIIKTVPSNLVNGEVKVFEILKKYEKLSRKEIEELSKYNKSKVIRSINGLIEKSIVEQVGKGRSVKYQLKK